MAPPGGDDVDTELVAALSESQRLGMLGARSIADVVDHAGAFVVALAGVSGTVVDLGSGGGVPGLVIARARPDLRLVLVDRRASRADHLRRLVGRLGMADRVEVLTLDADALGERRPGGADAVVARGFGAPAVTLRAAVTLLRLDGLAVVSEPPRPSLDRWPPELLGELGLTPVASADRRVVVFRRVQRESERPSAAAPPKP